MRATESEVLIVVPRDGGVRAHIAAYRGFTKHNWRERTCLTEIGLMECRCPWYKRAWLLITRR